MVYDISQVDDTGTVAGSGADRFKSRGRRQGQGFRDG